MPLSNLTKPNLVFFITDQQRQIQHWPDGWAEKNLHALTRLQNHGLTFLNAFSPACECSPSRASMITSTYPEENGVEVTFTTALNPSDTNLAQVLASAGYPVIWKGKWHLSHPSNGSQGTWTEGDITYLQTTYGIQQWNPPDAGTTLSDGSTLGGGIGANDARFVTGQPANGFGTSVLDFISSYDASTSGPFCLVVSLVNPHDVFLYPQQLDGSGYTLDQFQNAGIGLPPNQNDDLTTKPKVQLAFRKQYGTETMLPDEQTQLNYVNFYAWLHTQSDALFCQVLDALCDAKLLDDTIIFRFADHGEMGLSHGLQEKMYTAYEEAMHVPLIVSNPVLFPTPQTTTALASLIDILPTVAEITGSTNTSTLRGQSLVRVIDDPTQSVQDSVVYTYDDEFHLPATMSGHIRCLRTAQYKYAVYFTTSNTNGNFEYELYDLDADPGELTNLVHGTVSPATQQLWQSLHTTLTDRLKALGAFPTGVDWPATV